MCMFLTYPHVSVQALEQQAMEKSSRRDQEKAANATAPDYNPWGQGVGHVERDSSGKVLKRSTWRVGLFGICVSVIVVLHA